MDAQDTTMDTVSLKDQISQEVDRLTTWQQKQLLHLARQMQKSPLPPGTPGEVLLANAERFQYAPEALDEMRKVIEEEREKVDWDGWQ